MQNTILVTGLILLSAVHAVAQSASEAAATLSREGYRVILTRTTEISPGATAAVRFPARKGMEYALVLLGEPLTIAQTGIATDTGCYDCVGGDIRQQSGNSYGPPQKRGHLDTEAREQSMATAVAPRDADMFGVINLYKCERDRRMPNGLSIKSYGRCGVHVAIGERATVLGEGNLLGVAEPTGMPPKEMSLADFKERIQAVAEAALGKQYQARTLQRQPYESSTEFEQRKAAAEAGGPAARIAILKQQSRGDYDITFTYHEGAGYDADSERLTFPLGEFSTPEGFRCAVSPVLRRGGRSQFQLNPAAQPAVARQRAGEMGVIGGTVIVRVRFRLGTLTMPDGAVSPTVRVVGGNTTLFLKGKRHNLGDLAASPSTEFGDC